MKGILVAALMAAGVLGLLPVAPESAIAQDVPALPPGLEADADAPSDDAPALPPGLDGDGGPDLPPGLGDDEPDANGTATGAPDEARPADALEWLDLTGFWEARLGVRTQDDPHQDEDLSIAETRVQLDAQTTWEQITFKLVADVLYDGATDSHCVDLERGTGLLDLRQANVLFTPVDFMDVKVGRQILTWGTGDLLFLNDLFPKDWRAFFIGRDVEYLKAPSDAARFSMFSDVANLDVVYVPRFDASRFPTGRRLSYWNGNLGRLAGQDAVIDADDPDEWFNDQEVHARLHKRIEGIEYAGYYYWGYWKRPLGQTMAGTPIFPRLSVYGGSVRGPLGGGIANVEGAYYDSMQDRSGSDPLKRNSEVRLLGGYERDLPRLAEDLTVGAQYYIEWMMDHDEYRRTLPPGARARDEVRHLMTFRLTKLLMNQNLRLSLFAYYSWTDGDVYLRPKAAYKIDDHWTVECGGNVFFGDYPHTFFGQMQDNTNVYAAVRYGF